MEYKLFDEYITLQALLKELSIIHSGGAIKGFLANNVVLFNGEEEKRRGKKLRYGDVITIPSEELEITIVVPTQSEIEKQNLMTYLDVDTENNYYYSEVQGRELYFVNEALKVPKYGRVELVEAETSFTAYQEFQSMLTKDRIDIFMVGEFDDYQVLRGLHRFPLEGRQVDLQFSYNQPYSKVVKEKIETRQTSQSILQLGYQFPCQYGDKDYFALIVFNGMLGEFAHSALFTKIREKEGLAYSIGSQFDAFTGLLEIYAGIEKSNRNQAMRGIIRELNHIKLGRFSSSLFNQTKKIIRMNALLSEDHALTLVEQHFNKVIFGDKKISLEDWLDKIEKVTKKDVCRIARQVKLQSLFFLEGVS